MYKCYTKSINRIKAKIIEGYNIRCVYVSCKQLRTYTDMEETIQCPLKPMLQNYVIPKAACKWHEMSMQLYKDAGVTHLDTIRKQCPDGDQNQKVSNCIKRRRKFKAKKKRFSPLSLGRLQAMYTKPEVAIHEAFFTESTHQEINETSIIITNDPEVGVTYCHLAFPDCPCQRNRLMRSKNVAASVCHSHHGTYCSKCRKTVCMCTVKDHLVCEHSSVCTCKNNMAVEVADEMVAFVFLSLILKLLLLSVTAFICLSTLQPTDSSGKKIESYQMASSFASCNNDLKLNDDQPQEDTHLVIICVALILFFTTCFSVVCSTIESSDVQTTGINVAYSLKHERHLLIDDFAEISNMVGLIPGDIALKFNNNEEIFKSSKCLSEILPNNSYLAEEIQFVLNAGIEDYNYLQANNVLQDVSSLKVSFLYSKSIFEEVASQLAMAIGACNAVCDLCLDNRKLPLSLQDTCKQIMLESNHSNYTVYKLSKPPGDNRNAQSKQESGLTKSSMLVTSSNREPLTLSITVDLHETRNQGLVDVNFDVLRPIDKDGVKPVPLPSNQRSFANQMSHETLASAGNHHNDGDSVDLNGDKQLDVQQSNATTTERDQPLEIQPESYHMHMAASNANVQSSQMDKNIVERDGHSPLHDEKNQKAFSNLEEDVVEKDGKLPMASGADQATPLSSIPTEHKLMIGNVTSKASQSVDHNPIGAQFVKGLSKETEVLPSVGPQLGTLYDTNFDQEVQRSREEVRQRGNTRTTFFQHEVEQHAYNPMKMGEINSPKNPPMNNTLQVKPPEVKSETGKSANNFKPKALPKRSCIVSGNKQFPLVNNLVSLPHMDHYFVKQRTEIRPSHFLAKLVLRHQYQNRDDVSEETPAITAAQQSQAAVRAADSAVERDGAVTERKHFPMNLNRPGFVVFSSDLTRFTGSTKYPLPSRKATAVKLGKGGNGFVFAIFHNGKEYAVKKTVYRPNEIRVHSQLAHSNLVNLDAVLVGEEHEKHKGKFYAFCFMTKCDMDFRAVISTKDHGCLKHLKLQLSDQHDVWQLVMVNVKYVLRSVLKALDYMHEQGLVHRDVKASNVLLKMQCNCSKPLMCACPQKYLVKLGDFDSSTTVPGHGLRIEPHQMIRYASVLPLGTMGYRAPEVSMHLVIAGPYEVLYTTAVDIWSFGCLLLNMLIGKCGPLKQRGEASLLLSTQEKPYAESLYKQIIKVKELQKYYGDMPEMVDLVRKCLQVKVHCRPTAKQLLQLDILQCV